MCWLQAKIFWDFLSQSLRFSFNNVTVTELKEILIISSAPQAKFFLENQPSDPYMCFDPNTWPVDPYTQIPKIRPGVGGFARQNLAGSGSLRSKICPAAARCARGRRAHVCAVRRLNPPLMWL